MNLDEQIRLTFPHHLARMYEAARLENEPRMRVQKLVEFYGEVVRYLALIRLATYDHLGIQTNAVQQARQGLRRPSLGHWLTLMEKLGHALAPYDRELAKPPVDRKHRGDAIAEATAVLSEVAGSEAPNTIRVTHFLRSVVEFRNKKIGHGSLSRQEAKRVLEPLETALGKWLSELNVLRERHLVYVGRVDYVKPIFRYIGTNLNSGSTLDPYHDEEPEGVERDRVYLHIPETEEAPDNYIPLYPYFAFDEDGRLVFVYDMLSNRGEAELRCPYEPTADSRTLEIDKELILSGPPQQDSEPEDDEVAGVDVDEIEEESEDDGQTPDDESDGTTRGYGYMSNWFEIITPHRDIREGDFSEDIFAADIGDVHRGDAPDDYRDPYIFYKKTYLTAGLEALLRRVHRKLSEGKGPSVIQIQTPFGGGKTHSLVAIYHYVTNGEQVKSLLPGDLGILSPLVTVISGNHFNPVEGNTSDGITRYTFWGELAYQLAGRTGYEFMRANDEARISPGKAKLRDFLEGQQPFVLLFDEILHYINRAYDYRDKVEQSLGTQTFSFFQELTETVASLPQGMMIVTLPSSHLEDFGDQEEESLAKLGKIFGRVETIETPVQGEEVYAVIRRRLFEVEGMKQTAMREVVHRYFQQYQQNRDDLPAKARDLNYRDKMEKAYPFHPDVIDILYEKWSTYSSFQRTRGVLRLLANVVEDLYQREVNIDMILPGDINLEVSGLREEFLKHTGREYEAVIASDVAGHEAKSQALDKANKQWKHLGQRIATAIFFHSFTAEDSEKGVSLPYIKLATMRSNTIPAMVTDVLQKLANTLWYLNNRGESYYFSKIPNLNRMILDKKELFNETYQEEMEAIIKRETGQRFDNYIWPRNGDGIPDNQKLKLIVLHPSDRDTNIGEWVERKGQSFREYKNTLFFALADIGAFARLREEVKTYLALHEIKREVESEPNSPLSAKKPEIQQRMHKIQRDFSDNVRRMYHTIHFGGREIDLGQPVSGLESLGNWYWRELTSTDRGAIVEHLHYRLIVNRLMQGHERLAIHKILEQFYKNTDLPAPASPQVVARAIQLGVEEGALGLAFGDEEGEIKPESIRFEENVALSAIVFEPGIFLLSRDLARKLRVSPDPVVDYEALFSQAIAGADQISTNDVLDRIRRQPEAPEEIDTDAVAQALQTAVEVGNLGMARRTNGEVTKKEVRFRETVPLSAISFGPDVFILSPQRVQEIIGKPIGPDPTPPGPSPDGPYHHIRLVVSGIPASRIADVNRGIFIPLSSSVDGLTFTMEIDVSSEEGISKETLENKIKETIRQIGARVEHEEKE